MLPFRDKKETKLSQNREKAGYEEIIDMNDGRINVMLLGTSGCGKSTLINAMLGEEKADTGVGEAVTREIAVYHSDTLPFRMIFLTSDRVPAPVRDRNLSSRIFISAHIPASWAS